jgi:D-xylose 1-dehydrogenase (NADP+, D-xylono-1,5-lactone-forming)
MGDRFRWGIVSTARINRAFIPGVRATAGAELVAVASRDGERARAFAAEWEIPDALASYAELIARDDIDAVYIPVPNHLHAPLTIEAADAGKHVLCEKPLALSVDEVAAVHDAAKRNGVVVAEAFMYRSHPQTLRIQELIAAGRIGTVQLVHSGFSFVLDRQGDVRFDPAMGGGALWDVGCYPVSFARAVIGQEPVEALGWQRTGETGVDLSFTGMLRFPGGAVAQIDAGFESPYRSSAEIVGTEGVISVPRPFRPDIPAEIFIGPAGDQLEPVVIDAPGELARFEIEDLMAAARGDRGPRVTLADSRGTVAALVALYLSATSERAVVV